MVLTGFEREILASEWTQTHALDGATTGIGYMYVCMYVCLYTNKQHHGLK